MNCKLSFINYQLSIIFGVLCLTACQSHHYALQSVQPHRIEVTRALDSRPLAAATAFIAPFTIGVDSLRAPRVGQSAEYMTSHRPESLLSNWVADALVAAATRQGYQPDLGVCNIGGLRAAMPKGVVTQGDIINISPFENFLCILSMRGSDVLSLMGDIAAVGGEGVSASARIHITPDGRLLDATLAGQPIDTTRIYTIATLDYLAEGNDKLYSMRKYIDRKSTGHSVRELLMEELRLLDAAGQSATAAIEGRVSVSETRTTDNPVTATATPLADTTSPQQIDITPSSGAKSRQLLIVHTNDTHSCIEPLSPHLADTVLADKGGYLRRAALIRDLRNTDPDLLLLDAGDFSQGSPYYSLYHGDVEIGLMNLMQYDAATIGNHEFDFGLDNMARIFRMAKFPIVCCNYDFTGTPVEGLVKPYVVLRRSGMRIGITGLSPQLEGLVAAHTCQGVKFIDPITAVQPVIDQLVTKEKCDLVICLSHLGWNVQGISDEELIPATHGIDLVIGGHSHTYFLSPKILKNAEGKTVPVNQMGKNAQYVGTLRLNMQKR